MPSFISDGVEIAYLDEGAGEPILLIHGFASNKTVNWVDTGWVRHLVRQGRRVVAMDNRGHGESAKLHRPEDYSAKIMAEDARRLLDYLGIARADVIGYSMGARISAFLALAHPGRVKSLIFGGLGGNMVRPMAGTSSIAAALEAPSIDDVKIATARTFRAFADSTKSDLKSLAACIRSSREPLTAEMVAQIACPVLVVVGTDDVIGGPAADLARLIPGAEAVALPDKDHMKAVGDRGFKDAASAFLGRQG